MFFATLSDPTRRAILRRLASGAASVTELAEPFDMSLPAVSGHLKVLERAGLITRSRDAQWRRYLFDDRPQKDAFAWPAHYRGFWTQSFDRMNGYLNEINTTEKLHARNSISGKTV